MATSPITELSTAGAILPISHIILLFTSTFLSFRWGTKSSIIIEDSGKPITPKDVAAASLTLSEKSERHLPKAFIISSEIYSWSKSIPSKLESFSWEILS